MIQVSKQSGYAFISYLKLCLGHIWLINPMNIIFGNGVRRVLFGDECKIFYNQYIKNNTYHIGWERISMKKISWVLLLICQFVFAVNVGIIPTPQQVELSDQSLRLTPRIDYKLIGDPQNLEKGCEILSETIREIADGNAGKTTMVIL